MKLSEFKSWCSHYPQLRDAIQRIESKPILLPVSSRATRHTTGNFHACLKSEIYQDRHKELDGKIPLRQQRYGFSTNCDKESAVSTSMPINQCRGRIEHQVISHHELLAVKGFTISKTAHIQQLMHGRGRLLQDLVGTGQKMSDFRLQRPQTPLP